MNEFRLHPTQALDQGTVGQRAVDQLAVDSPAIDFSAIDFPAASARSPFATLVPVPVTLAQTGLALGLLRDLLLKHLFAESVASIRRLATRLHLAGAVVEELTTLLRDDALLELSRELHGDGTLAYRLSERGRRQAQDALSRSGYVGPAPVPLTLYRHVVESFSTAQRPVTRTDVQAQFDSFVIEPDLLDQLGAAFNARRAVFVYGGAGTGKTYTLGRLGRLFHDVCMVPYAIAIKEAVVQVFDPQLHVPLADDANAKANARTLRFADSYDTRFVPCTRPIVVTGGELTADLLEVQFDMRTQMNQAPLQLKANNGIFFIDDIGRQSIAPQAIFNRWIIPMEERRDFLTLANGQHFEVPFDVQLVFSSNINPLDLADEASLRRIGFKIHFAPISAEAYRAIWCQVLAKQQLEFDESVLRYVLDELHAPQQVALLPCHPRDLIGMALTRSTYLGEERALTAERLAWAWRNYFVQLKL